MRPARFAFILLLPSAAAAFFPFSGRNAEAERKISLMKGAYLKGDCAYVMNEAENFFSLKPPSGIKRDGYYYLGLCYEKDGYPDKALNIYEIASELYPEDLRFDGKLADMYFSAGFYGKAAGIYSKMASLRILDKSAYEKLALARMKTGSFEAAADSFELAAKISDYSDDNLLAEYADCLVYLKRYDDALAVAGKMRGRRRYPVLARINAFKGDFARALGAISEGEKKFPGDMEIAAYSMNINFYSGLYGKALKKAESILKKEPGDRAALTIKAWSEKKMGREADSGRTLSLILGGGREDLFYRLAKKIKGLKGV